MLNTRTLHLAAAGVAFVVVASAVTAPVTAQAAGTTPSPGCRTTFDPRSWKLVYTCSEPGSSVDGSSARPAKTRNAAATCQLTGPATYCVGQLACWFTQQVTPFAPPASPPPTPGAAWGVRWCIRPDGTTSGTPMWQSDAGQPAIPSLQEQAASAVGALRIPTVAATTSPPGLAVVNLRTFFAPATPLPAQLRGSSAFGVVAVASASGWVIDPGDGGPTVRCPATATLPLPTATAAPDGCEHLYRRPSTSPSPGRTARDGEGRPGYVVRARSTWSVRFELNGAAVTIPGAPTSVDGPVTSTVLPVVEVRSVVRR